MASDGATSNGTGGKPPLPGWRFYFFAALLLIVVLGGKYLEIPREVAIPVTVGCILALANGVLPTWFGKDK